MKKEKIVIIGMGFIATFLMPCYRRLLGDALSTNVVGIKGSDRGLAKKQAQCPFPVIVGRVRETLEEQRPDIIILAVRPHQIAEMTEKTLAPYYEMLREKGEALPDLYSLAPDPTVDYYYDVLGGDVNCANLLPNEIDQIAGNDVSGVGVAFISFDPRREWPAEKKKRALEFMIPSGTVVTVDADKAIPFLSLHSSSHLMFEVNYLIEDVTAACGKRVPLTVSGSAFRTVFRTYFNDPSVEVIPYEKGGIDENLAEFMDVLLRSWRAGALRFAAEETIPLADADRMLCGSIETYLMEAQLKPREELMKDTKNHATPGGFLEKCLTSFAEHADGYLKEQIGKWLHGEKDEDTGAKIEEIAYTIIKAVSDHGKTISGVKS